ncbi:hypothetical protein MJ588_07055 [Klebsiella pneumoniae]|nr:hypothetical protein MJ588_07055 [Klebsiella pneumoniae]
MVDHVGHIDTPHWPRSPSARGEILSKLPEVRGCRTEAKVADYLRDQQNRWVLDDAQGLRNLGMEYEKTVNEHYRPFLGAGRIAVAVIDADVDFPNAVTS